MGEGEWILHANPTRFDTGLLKIRARHDEGETRIRQEKFQVQGQGQGQGEGQGQ